MTNAPTATRALHRRLMRWLYDEALANEQNMGAATAQLILQGEAHRPPGEAGFGGPADDRAKIRDWIKGVFVAWYKRKWSLRTGLAKGRDLVAERPEAPKVAPKLAKIEVMAINWRPLASNYAAHENRLTIHLTPDRSCSWTALAAGLMLDVLIDIKRLIAIVAKVTSGCLPIDHKHYLDTSHAN